MKPLEHRTQSQTDGDAERIGFLIELHCVLESCVALLQYYERDRGNGIAMHLYVPYPSIQHRLTASGSRRCVPRWPMTPSAQTDERRGITSAARNRPMARSCPPFWILFCPGLGYYSADGEARKTAVFLKSDFQREFESCSLQRRVHLSRDFIFMGQKPRLSLASTLVVEFSGRSAV